MVTHTAVEENETPEITMVDPAVILTDRNTRYGLIPGRVESLKEKIVEAGEVLQPIMVEALSTKEMSEHEGYEYRAVFGHYRIAALLAARKEGSEILMPCIITEPMGEVDRLKVQLMENIGRSEQTPIDRAVAMKALLDNGLSKMEVRQLFATPGGRKGLKSQPLSNSSLNMTLSFLEFPKKIQNMIHEGEIGVADAYFLTKVAPEDRDGKIEQAKAKRLKELEDAEEEERKFLEKEKKLAEQQQKVIDAEKAIDTAKETVTAVQEDLKAKTQAAAELYVQKSATEDAEEKAKLEAAHKEAEKAAKDAQKLLDTQRKELAKQLEKADKSRKEAEERLKKLAEAREAAAKASKTALRGSAQPLQVKKSAASEVRNAPNTDGVPITLAALTKVVKDMTLAGSYPKVSAIGNAFRDLMNGRIKDGAFMNQLAVITGEKAEPKAPAKAKKAS